MTLRFHQALLMNRMRKALLLLVFLGCGGRSPVLSGGNPDAGDEGALCENTVVEVPLEMRRHIPEERRRST